MFKNYFLLAFRNMRKNLLHTIINVLGMTVALACSIFIALLIYRYFTFDRFQQNKKSIYKVYSHQIGPNGAENGTAMPYPITPALLSENVGIIHATSVLNAGRLVLSCMGLFGIASIIIRQRVKEIGVRKVLGATITNIFTLVRKEFLKPVIIALIIAVPICWLLMNTWLEHYTYRIHIHWWIFVIAGLVSLTITIFTVSFQSIKAAIADPVKNLRTE